MKPYPLPQKAIRQLRSAIANHRKPDLNDIARVIDALIATKKALVEALEIHEESLHHFNSQERMATYAIECACRLAKYWENQLVETEDQLDELRKRLWGEPCMVEFDGIPRGYWIS